MQIPAVLFLMKLKIAVYGFELGDPIHALFEQEEGQDAMLAIIRSARTFAFYENENLPPE